MIEKIYIVRHGFRINSLTTYWTSPTGLPRDPPLAVFGVSQAQEAAAYFKGLPEEERPLAIYSSPYYRCLQTAQPIGEALSLPLYVEHGISEWYSPVAPGTGLHPRPKPAAELQEYFSAIDASYSSVWYPSRKGEDLDEIHERVDRFLTTFVANIERHHPEQTRVLLVSHAATIIALVRSLLGRREHSVRVACCSLSTFTRSHPAEVLGAWDAVSLVDVSHLKDGALRDWGFEDIEIANGKVTNDQGVPGSENEVEDHSGRASYLFSSL